MDDQCINRDYAAQFHQTGVTGPFQVIPEDLAESHLDYTLEEILRKGAPPGPEPGRKINNRHVDHRPIWDLCSHDEITKRMRKIYGPNLMLWNSRFWVKKPGAPTIPWHQHFHHMDLVPSVTLTAWIALTDCTVENGAVEIEPNTHREPLPQVETPDGYWEGFQKMTDPEEFEVEDPITMDLTAGEAFIFNERTLHRSPPNTTDDSVRIGLSARVTLPQVYLGEAYGEKGNSAVMISGNDTQAINPMATPPQPAQNDPLADI